MATDTTAAAQRQAADADTHFRVQQFYFHEAELLDDGRFTDWLDLLAEDLHYWAPTRSNRLRRQQSRAVAARGEAAFFDETRASLAWRIRRFDSGMAWAEDPPSRTRHLVSNVIVRHTDEDEREIGQWYARSNFIVYRNRLEREVDIYSGGREDILRETENGLVVARRTILLDQNVLLAKNISTFF